MFFNGNRMEFMQSLNIGAVIFMAVVFIYLYIMDIVFRKKLRILFRDEKVIAMQQQDLQVKKTFLPLYLTQGYSIHVNDVFVQDPYKALPKDLRSEKLRNDFYVLFQRAIQAIKDNQDWLVKNYQVMKSPECLKYDFILDIVKFAYFTLVYGSYLEEDRIVDNNMRLQIEKRFPFFDRYHVDMESQTCKRNVHIMYFVSLAISLCQAHSEAVRACILFDRCGKPVTSQETLQETCSL